MSLENPRTSILWASVDSVAGRTLMDITGTLFRLRRIIRPSALKRGNYPLGTREMSFATV